MRALALLFTFVCSLPAVAAEEPIYIGAGANFGLVKHSTVSISDNVTENCWTNSRTVKSQMKLALEQNAVAVVDYDPAFFHEAMVSTHLSAFGYRTSGGMCAVAAKFSVETWVRPTLGKREWGGEYVVGYNAVLTDESSIFTNSANVNEQIGDFATGALAEFLAQVLAGRRMDEVIDFHSVYPSFGAAPISAEEWKKQNSASNEP